jgi:hypothetical protein
VRFCCRSACSGRTSTKSTRPSSAPTERRFNPRCSRDRRRTSRLRSARA